MMFQKTKRKTRMKKAFSFLLALLIMGQLLLPVDFVFAADPVVLTIKNLEAGDLVEIYRIASYSDLSGYSWESSVSDWIATSAEGRPYKELTTGKLSEMTAEAATEFCSSLLVGLKDEAKKVANLNGYTFLVDEEKESYTTSVAPGYYIVLPKGSRRIYSLKLLKVEPNSSPTITYDALNGDYQMPIITDCQVTNITSDRGLLRGGTFLLADDGVLVEATVTLPTYPNMYATGKRILNLSLVVPAGLDYKEDSLELSIEDEESYSIGTYENAVLYKNSNGEVLFFGTTKGYFYEIGGSQLVAQGSAEDAMNQYNSLHETSYVLAEPPFIKTAQEVDAEGADSTANTEVENTEAANTEPVNTESENQDNENQETENQEIESEDQSTEVETSELTAVDESKIITYKDSATVFVIALDTEAKLDEVSISYQASKNAYSSATGIYDNLIGLTYSTSPLDSNRLNMVKETARTCAYGIQITIVRGQFDSAGLTPDQQLATLPRLTGSEFYLYRLTETFDGDQTEGYAPLTQISTGTGEDVTGQKPVEVTILPQMIYDEETDKTYRYEYVRTLSANSIGVVSVGGIEADQYLLVQSTFPTGYALSTVSIVIGRGDWTNEVVMEGNNTVDLVWLDYETQHLPGTGSIGYILFAVVGTLLCLIAAMALFLHKYPGILVEIKENFKKIHKKSKKVKK